MIEKLKQLIKEEEQRIHERSKIGAYYDLGYLTYLKRKLKELE